MWCSFREHRVQTWWAHQRTRTIPQYDCVCGVVSGNTGYRPGGLIKEHEGWVVDQLQGDGQPFPLTPGEVTGPRLLSLQQAKCVQDLIHLQHTTTCKTINMSKILSAYKHFTVCVNNV